MANDINNSEAQYRYLLENSLNKVTEEIALLELQKDTFLGIIKQNEKRIEKLRVEQTRLKQELENRNSKEITKTGGKAEEVMDTVHTMLSEKQKVSSQKINAYQQLMASASSSRRYRKISRKMYREKRKQLRRAKIIRILDKLQRATIMPKYLLDKIRLKRYASAQGNYNFASQKLAELGQSPNASERKKEKYEQKKQKAQEKLRKLKEKGVTAKVIGANVAAINKEDTKKLRQRITDQKTSEVENEEKAEKKETPVQQEQTSEEIKQTTSAEPSNITANEEAKQEQDTLVPAEVMPPRDDFITAESLVEESIKAMPLGLPAPEMEGPALGKKAA